MTRRGMTYVSLFFEDFRDGCEDLSNELIGVYLRVLFEIYSAMGPIEYNLQKLGRRLNCRPHKAKALVDELIGLRKLFLTSDGKISNHRAETEIARYVRISFQNGLNRSSKTAAENSTGKKLNENSQTRLRPSNGRAHTHIEDITNLQPSALHPREALEEGGQPEAAPPHLAEFYRRRQASKGRRH